MLTIEVIHPYPCRSEELLPYFLEQELVIEKYQRIKAESIRFSQPAEMTIHTQREVESDIPAKLKSLLGSRNTLIQEEQWQQLGEGQYQCQMSIKLEGVPITIEGTMEISDTDEGCENCVTLKLRCALPFIGKKLEQFVASSSEQMMDDEYGYLHDVMAKAIADEN